ncbi:MAG: DUF4367 domain-containing protein [Firmicutes bacterium]|nr:DUF4367 domain-containing protein [Bacillota bacterium]
MDREVKEKQSQQHESRSFAYLANKSPEELLVEMQALVDSMDERSFDGELVNAYLDRLQELDPVLPDYDAEQEYDAFAARYAKLHASKASPQKATKKHHRISSLRWVSAAAIVCFVLLAGTVTANAFGVNVFAKVVDWGSDALRIIRNDEKPCGALVLPASSDQEYHSIEEALAAHDLDSADYLTWIPERFNIELIDAIEIDSMVSITALYLDEEGGALNYSVEAGMPDTTVINIEIDEGSGETYHASGTEYYLATNMGDQVASWMDETCVYCLSGPVTNDEIKQMLAALP